MLDFIVVYCCQKELPRKEFDSHVKVSFSFFHHNPAVVLAQTMGNIIRPLNHENRPTLNSEIVNYGSHEVLHDPKVSRTYNIDDRKNGNESRYFSIAALTKEEGTFSQVSSLLLILFFVGSSISFIVRKLSAPQNVIDEDVRHLWIESFSTAIGYTYTISWGFGPCPQFILNYKRKSTVGLSIDSSMYQVLAATCYSIYNAGMFYSKTVQTLYSERHNGNRSRVDGNDVAFALYSTFMNCLILCQIVYYGHKNRNVTQDLSKEGKMKVKQPTIRTGVSPLKSSVVVIGTVLLTSILYAISISFSAPKFQEDYPFLNWLDFCYALSWAKIIIVLLKYIPQVILNFQRRSTKGWSIFTVFLDINGGILSILQLFLDCWNHRDWGGVVGNLAKFMLGLVSLLFDVSLLESSVYFMLSKFFEL